MQRQTSPIRLRDEAATAALAACVAPRLGPGDVLLLAGPIGAGKTSFARALIRARVGRADEDVPSPTFTLVQTYDAADVEIWHADLYRLADTGEVVELGLDAAFETAICLVEWPERMGDFAPTDAVTLRFSAGTEAHTVTLSGPPDRIDRLEPCLA